MKHHLSVLLAYFIAILQIKMGLGLSVRKMKMLLSELNKHQIKYLLSLYMQTDIKEDNLEAKRIMVSVILFDDIPTKMALLGYSCKTMLEILGSNMDYANFLTRKIWQSMLYKETIMRCENFESLIRLFRFGIYNLGVHNINGQKLIDQVTSVVGRKCFTTAELVRVLHQQKNFISIYPAIEGRMVYSIGRYGDWDNIKLLKKCRPDLIGNINFYVNKYRRRKHKRK